MRRFAVWLVVLGLVGAGGVYAWSTWNGASSGGPAGGRGARRGPPDAPVSVLTEAARIADVPVTLEAVGTAQALNTVTVRSQVDGRLLALAFQEGQDVKAGDILARIDPTIYQAQYDQAVAKRQQDEATLANARLDLTRYVNLAQTNYGSKQQADTQRASVSQLEAQVKADAGAVDSARAYLDYTTVRAPIAGRTGIRLVDAGNLVKAADTTGLVVITQLQPLAAIFNLPQQSLRAVNAATARGPVAVDALESDGRTVVDSGRIEVVDNQVDATTGTVKVKAVFPNARLQLWPGSFVNVRLTVDTLRDATVIPTASVQRGPTGPFVYGVQDGKAVLKPVTLGRQTETVTVVTAGLAPAEPVITTGFARLTDGDAVTVADPNAVQPSAPRRSRAAGARGEGGRPEGAQPGGARPDGEARDPARPRRMDGEARGAPGGRTGQDGAGTTGSTAPARADGVTAPGTAPIGTAPAGTSGPAGAAAP